MNKSLTQNICKLIHAGNRDPVQLFCCMTTTKNIYPTFCLYVETNLFLFFLPRQIPLLIKDCLIPDLIFLPWNTSPLLLELKELKVTSRWLHHLLWTEARDILIQLNISAEVLSVWNMFLQSELKERLKSD